METAAAVAIAATGHPLRWSRVSELKSTAVTQRRPRARRATFVSWKVESTKVRSKELTFSQKHPARKYCIYCTTAVSRTGMRCGAIPKLLSCNTYG